MKKDLTPEELSILAFFEGIKGKYPAMKIAGQLNLASDTVLLTLSSLVKKGLIKCEAQFAQMPIYCAAKNNSDLIQENLKKVISKTDARV